jgi:acyl-CoA thioester hydrolase
MSGVPYASATEIRARFAETDAQGIIHNSVYLVWFELARVEYLERFTGGYPVLRDKGVEAIVTESHVRYREPARFDDRLVVRTSCRDIRGARFRFVYEVDRDGTTIADGETAHACVDARTFLPTRVPSWLAEAIAKAEATA